MKIKFPRSLHLKKKKLPSRSLKRKRANLKEPELGRGYIDFIEYKEGKLSVAGWMFLPGTPFDNLVLKINNIPMKKAPPIQRNDVQGAFPHMKDASLSGFFFTMPVEKEVLAGWVDIDIIGIFEGAEVAKLTTLYRIDFHASLPEPPSEFMQRIANVDSSMGYWCRALKSFSEFFKEIQKYSDWLSIQNFLDWGCGCGRVTSLFLKHSKIPHIYGCDIDKETIGWCQENLPECDFSVINPFPPTHFDSDMFDVIIGYSVFTHLKSDVQLAWLQELQRITKPGCFLYVSVHGEFAASFAPPHVQKEMMKNGISDSSLDPNLDGIAPAGYYRGVYQQKTYTAKEWGKYFRIVDYKERGMGNFQDLVVMKKE
jgi:SAM-dependent methyltransferase